MPRKNMVTQNLKVNYRYHIGYVGNWEVVMLILEVPFDFANKRGQSVLSYLHLSVKL